MSADFFFLMIRRPPRSTLDRSSAASDVYKRQGLLWQEVLKLVTGFDVTKCPGCKNGIMLPAGALQPERAPPI